MSSTPLTREEPRQAQGPVTPGPAPRGTGQVPVLLTLPMHQTRWTDAGLWCADCHAYVNLEKGSRKVR